VSSPGMHACRPPSHSAYLAPSAWAEAERCVQTGPTAAYQHPGTFCYR